MVVPASHLRLPYLQQWRLRAALTQEALAHQAGISRSTVHNAEDDKDVLPSTVLAIAKALKLKPHELQRPPPSP